PLRTGAGAGGRAGRGGGLCGRWAGAGARARGAGGGHEPLLADAPVASRSGEGQGRPRLASDHREGQGPAAEGTRARRGRRLPPAPQAFDGFRQTAGRRGRRPAGVRRGVEGGCRVNDLALKLGFVPLLDAAGLVIAEAKGFFAAEGLNVELVREVSW